MSEHIPHQPTQAQSDSAQLPESLVLIVTTGAARGQNVVVGDRLRIGKAAENDLVLPDDAVSRYHCELERTATGVLVRDLGSTNHTRIGRSVITEATLAPGASLTVGDVELVLRVEARASRMLPIEDTRFGETLGSSVAMRTIFGVLTRIAPTDASILLEGETGTGKDVLARSIHASSSRKSAPLHVVDCGAISYNLIESELFGHERGAFTGAVSSRSGAFELAAGGTLFLDEVGELPLDVQPKLLRVLESGEYRRVGGNRTSRSDCRVIAATKRDLRREIEQGKFREDLYFRLAVVPITVPPLRSRREDIPMLIEHFAELASKRDPGAATISFSTDTIQALASHDWPGNVRELRNVLDRAIYMATASGESTITAVDVPLVGSATNTPQFSPSLSYRETRAKFEQDFEIHYVSWLLKRHDGNISKAAREARMDRKHLYDLAKKHDLRERFDKRSN